MIVDTALRVSLVRGGKDIDAFVAQSPEGTMELAVEMLRRAKRLYPGDQITVESLLEYVRAHRDEPVDRRLPEGLRP